MVIVTLSAQRGRQTVKDILLQAPAFAGNSTEAYVDQSSVDGICHSEAVGRCEKQWNGTPNCTTHDKLFWMEQGLKNKQTKNEKTKKKKKIISFIELTYLNNHCRH